MSLEIKTEFTRKLPLDAPVASISQSKEIDLTQKHDCMTGQQLKRLRNFDCESPGAKNEKKSVKFARAYIPYIILGSAKTATRVLREGHEPDNHKHDILLTF